MVCFSAIFVVATEKDATSPEDDDHPIEHQTSTTKKKMPKKKRRTLCYTKQHSENKQPKESKAYAPPRVDEPVSASGENGISHFQLKGLVCTLL